MRTKVFSGGNLKRPGFQRMMAFVRKGGCRAIVVYRLDRISRNISDFAGLIEELSGSRDGLHFHPGSSSTREHRWAGP